MSLNLAKLEKVRKLDGGIVQARCPACAELGQDGTGNHLRVLPDGRFGCCVHPKDGEHRKRIFALVGDKLLREVTVRLASAKMTSAEPLSVKATLAVCLGTPGTGKTEWEKGVPSVPNFETLPLGTLGTPKFNPYTYRKNSLHMYKDLESGVPSVPGGSEAEVVLAPTNSGERLPFLTRGGDLSIPFDSPERYHWWRGGQRAAETLREVKERMNHADDI